MEELSRNIHFVLTTCGLPQSLTLGDSAALKAVEETTGQVLDDLKMEFGTKEPSLSVQVRGSEEPVEACLGKGAAHRLLSLLDLLPHGVVKISHDVEGLVSRVAFDLEGYGGGADHVCLRRESGDVLEGSVCNTSFFLCKMRGVRLSG